MASNLYTLGKKNSTGIKHDTGKNMASHGAYPTSKLGKSSGTARGGDKTSCSAQGNGKGKSC